MPTLRNTALDTSTIVTPTTTVMQLSSTCLSDTFLAVCSLNQNDEDLAMSIKYRGVPFRLALTNSFKLEELKNFQFITGTILLFLLVMSVFRGVKRVIPF